MTIFTMPSATSCLGIGRATLLTVVTIINLALTTIMCLAITFGSGGRFQAILMGLDGFACLLPAAYWLHKIVFLNDHLFVRSITIFGILTLIGFATILLTLVRNDQQNGMALVNDLALLDHPTAMTNVVIALSILATLFSVVGFLVAQMGWMSQRMERQPVRDHLDPNQYIPTRQKDDQIFQSTNASTSTVVAGVELDINVGKRFNAALQSPSAGCV